MNPMKMEFLRNFGWRTVALCSMQLVIVAIIVGLGTTPTHPARAATFACGEIATDTTWTLADSPYVIDCSLTVPAGITLAIDPGVVIKFGGQGSSIEVAGALVAQGTEQQPVTFTSLLDDTAGGDTNGNGTSSTPARGDWGYIKGGTLDLRHTNVRYGGYCTSGMLTTSTPYVGTCGFRPNSTAASFTLDHVTLEHSSSTAVFMNVGTGSVAITNSNIRHNAFGMTTSGASVNVSNSSISENTAGGLEVTASGMATATLSNLTVVGNGGHGVGLSLYNGAAMLLSDSIVSDNAGWAVQLTGDSLAGTMISGLTGTGNGQNAVAISGLVAGDATLKNLPEFPYILGTFSGGLGVTATLTVEPGVVVKLGSYASIDVAGTLVAHGTEALPITFTSLQDDTAGGDSNGDGTSTVPARGDWGYIKGGTLDLRHTNVRYGGYCTSGMLTTSTPYVGTCGFRPNSTAASFTLDHVTLEHSSSTAVFMNVGTGSVAITNSNIRHNAFGMTTSGASVNVSNSSISENDYGGVEVVGQADGRHNWWGDASGPSPYGSGNSVNNEPCPPPNQGEICTVHVLVEPWLNDDPTGTSPSTYTVSGRVIDAHGVGIPGVLLSLSNMNATSDGDGAYEFVAVPVGPYTLTPVKTSHTFSPASRSLQVIGPNYGVDFVGLQSLVVTGKVVSADGIGIPDVFILSSDGNIALSAGDGTYSIPVTNNQTSISLTPSKPGFNIFPVRHLDIPTSELTQINFYSFQNPQCSLDGLDLNPNATGLILVTHGWGGLSRDILHEEIRALAESIEGALAAKGNSEQWDVLFVNWGQSAATLGPSQAAKNADIIGRCLGKLLHDTHYQDFHLIAHSAGAWLIEEVARELPAYRNVHETFLDPFIGWESGFGAEADWAEQYVNTNDAPLTNARVLEEVFSFDVTPLGTHYFSSIPDLVGGHLWPVRYYQCSLDRLLATYDALQSTQCIVPGALNQFALGFELSPAWSEQSTSELRQSYVPGGLAKIDYDSVVVESANSSDAVRIIAYGTLDLAANTHQSVTGAVQDVLAGLGKLLRIGSPVWFETTVSWAHPVNTLAFDYQFESTTSAFLTVEFDGEPVFIADGSLEDGVQRRTGLLPLPFVLNPGVEHRILFRLDGPEGSGAAITVKNVTPGYASRGPAVLTFDAPVTPATALDVFDVSVTVRDIDGGQVLSDDTSIVALNVTGGAGRLFCEPAAAVAGRVVFESCSIDLPGTYSLRAVANSGATSAEGPPLIVIPGVNTAVTITAGPSGPIAESTASFGFDAAGAVATHCRLDDAPLTSCSSPFSTPTLGSGPHSFEVRATYATGAFSSAIATFSVDTIAPEVTVDSKPLNPSGPMVAFSFSSSEPGTFECTLDSDAFFACASPLQLTGLTDGAHTLQVRAVDLAGNNSLNPVTITWTVDTVAPETTLTAGPSGTVKTSSATFRFVSSESPASFECTLDGGTFETCASPLNVTGLINGVHTLQVRALDAPFNVDSTPASRTWTVNDGAPPNTTIVSKPAKNTNSTSATFVFQGRDNSGLVALKFECQLDPTGPGSLWIPCNTIGPEPNRRQVSYAGLAEGTHTFVVRAKHPTGNVDGSPVTWVWAIDVTKPLLSYTFTELGSPETPYIPGSWARYSVRLDVVCSDSGTSHTGIASNRVVKRQTFGNGVWNVAQLGISPNSCVDRAGNSADPIGPWDVQVDTKAPTCTVTPASQWLTKTGQLTTVNLNLAVGDNLTPGYALAHAIIQSIVGDNGAVAMDIGSQALSQTGAATIEVRAVVNAPGTTRTYTVTFLVQDEAGNSKTCVARLRVK